MNILGVNDTDEFYVRYPTLQLLLLAMCLQYLYTTHGLYKSDHTVLGLQLKLYEEFCVLTHLGNFGSYILS
jgi:hypothetical protein